MDMFHWLGVYGGGRRKATADVDALFVAASLHAPEVFAADSRKEPARQAKFEHVSLWASAFMTRMNAAERQRFVEALIDRIEVGLRENGVGDMKVGVKVREHAGALNGRISRYMGLMAEKDWKGLKKAAGEHGVRGKAVEAIEGAL
jgi:hypothetical protein